MLQANGIAPVEKKRKLAATSSKDILDLTVDDNGSSSGRNSALKVHSSPLPSGIPTHRMAERETSDSGSECEESQD